MRPQSLEFASGHDLRVIRSSPTWGSMLGVEPASGFFFPSSPTGSLSEKRKEEKRREKMLMFSLIYGI